MLSQDYWLSLYLVIQFLRKEATVQESIFQIEKSKQACKEYIKKQDATFYILKVNTDSCLIGDDVGNKITINTDKLIFQKNKAESRNEYSK